MYIEVCRVHCTVCTLMYVTLNKWVQHAWNVYTHLTYVQLYTVQCTACIQGQGHTYIIIDVDADGFGIWNTSLDSLPAISYSEDVFQIPNVSKWLAHILPNE